MWELDKIALHCSAVESFSPDYGTASLYSLSSSPNVAHHHCQTCSAIQHSDDVDQCDEVLLHVTTQRKELKHEVDALYSPDSM